MSEHEAVRRRPRRGSAGVRQLPWRRLVNPYRPVEILSEDQVETIHRASLRILAEIGMQVLGVTVLWTHWMAPAREWIGPLATFGWTPRRSRH